MLVKELTDRSDFVHWQANTPAVLTNRRVVLRSRPVGHPRAENFALEEHAVPAPSADQVLLRTLYLSLDPYDQAGIEDAASPRLLRAPPYGDAMTTKKGLNAHDSELEPA
jgi:NADPH-dependent curcumin reductase CurA